MKKILQDLGIVFMSAVMLIGCSDSENLLDLSGTPEQTEGEEINMDGFVSTMDIA